MNRRLEPLITVLFLVAVSFWFAFLRFELNLEYEPATLAKVTAGSADRPFQYRVLIPWLFRAGQKAVPEFPLKGMAFCVEILATIALFLAFGNLARTIISVGRRVSIVEFLLLLGLVCTFILPRGSPYYYVSDMPSVFLITLGLLALKKKQHGFFFGVFTLGCFNRETILLLTSVFCFLHGKRLMERENSVLLLVQILIWVVVKGFLGWLYSENPGPQLAEWHLGDNFRCVLQPGSWPVLAGVFGFSGFALLGNLDRLPVGFERSALLGCLPLAGFLLLVGNVLEVRIFGDMLPIVLLALLQSWNNQKDALGIRENRE